MPASSTDTPRKTITAMRRAWREHLTAMQAVSIGGAYNLQEVVTSLVKRLTRDEAEDLADRLRYVAFNLTDESLEREREQKELRKAKRRAVLAGVSYAWRFTRCGKKSCDCTKSTRRHGPYLYGYQRVDGRTMSTYIGAKVPAPLRKYVAERPAPERTRKRTRAKAA